MDMQVSTTRSQLQSMIPETKPVSGFRSGMLAGTSLMIGLCIVWYCVVSSLTNGNIDDSAKTLSSFDPNAAAESWSLFPIRRLPSSAKASGNLSRQTHARFHVETATISVPEMIRKADNLRLAPIFQGMVLAPKLAYDVFLAASVDCAVDECGNTLLHLAARSGNHLYTWCLLEHGADPMQVNAGGQTVLQTVNCAPGQLRTAVLQCVSHHVRWRPALLAQREDEPADPEPMVLASDIAPANSIAMQSMVTTTEWSPNEESDDQTLESSDLPTPAAGVTAFDSTAVLSLGVSGRM